MNTVDRSWLAGLLEGEGTFCSAKTGGKGREKFRPRFRLVMTDEDVVARAAALLERPYRKLSRSPSRASHFLDAWVVDLNGQAAANVMKRLRPLMGARRQAQIDHALSEWGASACMTPNEGVVHDSHPK